LVPHIEAVTEVRLLLERQYPHDWVCERALAQRLRSEGTRAHLPDAVLETGNERIAVEVELTLKSRARLEALLLELGASYDQVWYFAAGSLLPRLRELAGQSPWQNIAVHPYPPRAAPAAA